MSGISIPEIAVILVIALLVFGPDRLPTMIKQAAAFVKDLRKMVANARRDLSDSVGDLGLDQEDLKTLSDLRNPRSYVRQKVLDGADLESFGLDEIKEAGDELELTDTRKRRTTNGAARNRKAVTSGSKSNTTTKTATATRAGRSTSGNSTSSTTAGVNGSGGSGESASAPAVEVKPASSPTGARFDPDAT
ncbi:twin-arginine translocase TatA/TatE family subunit [Phytoactinopolyspora endophytica]|uniref:twin-arginine translocase TatA/TatE family subunit n=1 Tax=Phytoactinopolyspora endophytica TaxID=1642495 RepID=UPI00101D55BC|nr:twin-arginine translocase TatA/TatE family subunit [Phytoactinopolyspora endophytica]